MKSKLRFRCPKFLLPISQNGPLHTLMTASRNHLVKRNVEYFITGNSITLTSFQEDTIANNHEENDTLIISCLSILNPIDTVVTVYSADTDVFVLLLKHHDIRLCKRIYTKIVSGCVHMALLHQALGGIFATALLSLHCLTGCDTTGKFAGISKDLVYDDSSMKGKQALEMESHLKSSCSLLVLSVRLIDFLVQQRKFLKMKSTI